MRLVQAELIKMRHRTMTWVLLGTQIGVMAFVFVAVGLLVGPALADVQGLPLPETHTPWRISGAIVGDFVFGGLGSLLVVIYAGAMVGAEYSWGVLRNPIARGEGREHYMLAKASAIGIVLCIGAAIAFVAGFLMVVITAIVAGLNMGPFSLETLVQLAGGWGLGMVVLLERAAIAIAVATLLRSQLAGIVVAVVLYVAEPIIANIAAAVSQLGQMFDPNPEPVVHWSQYLPFSVGSSVLNEGFVALPAPLPGLVANVPLWQALAVVLGYTTVAVVGAMLILRRQEIT
jgi:hypothetical protein